ncbi:SDR family NAD(P)-dependent oxidoreductase [Streptomyces dysideae]|uniref:SDR family NAD(P)-dependent oxidoreductase n=1 Tax=Streptomyces dysideae TaxID=909626 RepID=UPI000D15FF1B
MARKGQPQEDTGQLEELRAAGPGEVHYVHADFDSLAIVCTLASEISKITDRVDVLINNTGRPGAPRRRLSHDGNEATLQTNYLAPCCSPNVSPRCSLHPAAE